MTSTASLSTVQVDLDQLAQFALDMITRRVEQRDQGDGIVMCIVFKPLTST